MPTSSKAFAADGVTELHTAFSRADGPKTYVQHLVAAQKDKVWSLIEKGAIILRLRRRRQDGARRQGGAGARSIANEAGGDADAGLRWIDDLGTKNRYVLDVWAGDRSVGRARRVSAGPVAARCKTVGTRSLARRSRAIALALPSLTAIAPA